MTPDMNTGLLADLTAALVGLLTAQAFLVGFVLVRIDAISDESLRRLKDAERLLVHTPTKLGGSAEEISDEVSVVATSVISELRRPGSRYASSAVATAAAVTMYVAFRIIAGNGNPERWHEMRDLPHPDQWNGDVVAIFLLTLVTVGLAGLCWIRCAVTRSRVQTAAAASPLNLVRATEQVVNLAGQWVSPPDWRQKAALSELLGYRPHDPTTALVDRVRVLLSETKAALPSWALASALTGDFWLYVYQQPALQEATNVDAMEAIERTVNALSEALRLDNNLAAVRLRLAYALHQQAARSADGSPDRKQCLLRAQKQAQYVLNTRELDLPTCQLLIEILLMRRGDEIQKSSLDQAKVTEATKGLDEIFTMALSMEPPDAQIVQSWAEYQLASQAAPAAKTEVVKKLARVADLIVGQIRAADTNSDVLYLAEAAREILEPLGNAAASLSQQDRELILGRPLAVLFSGDGLLQVKDLGALRPTLAPMSAGYVLATTLYAKAIEETDSRWSYSRALWRLVHYPARRSATRIVVRASDALEALRVLELETSQSTK
jgi:hypothetical protein